MPRSIESYKAPQRDKLDAVGIDAICEMIERDMSYRAIAEQICVSEAQLRAWINVDPARSARARDALEAAAFDCDYKAEAVLASIPDDGTPAQIARARELASHLRWRAKARAPKTYGDRQQQEHSGAVTIQVVTGYDG